MKYPEVSTLGKLYLDLFGSEESENVYQIIGSSAAIFQFADFYKFLLSGLYEGKNYQSLCEAIFLSQESNFANHTKLVGNIKKLGINFQMPVLLDECAGIRVKILHEDIYGGKDSIENPDPNNEFDKYSSYYKDLLKCIEKIINIYDDYLLVDGNSFSSRYGFISGEELDALGIKEKEIRDYFSITANKQKLKDIIGCIGTIVTNQLQSEYIVRDITTFLFDVQETPIDINSTDSLVNMLNNLKNINKETYGIVSDVLDPVEFKRISYTRNEYVHRKCLSLFVDLFSNPKERFDSVVNAFLNKANYECTKSTKIFNKVILVNNRYYYAVGSSMEEGPFLHDPKEFILPYDNILRNSTAEDFFSRKGIKLKYSHLSVRKAIYKEKGILELFNLYSKEIYEKFLDWSDYCAAGSKPSHSFYNAINDLRFVFIGNCYIESKNEFKRRDKFELLLNYLPSYCEKITIPEIKNLLEEISKDTYVFGKIDFDGKPQGTVRINWKPKHNWPKHIEFYIKLLAYEYAYGCNYDNVVFDDEPNKMIPIDYLEF